MLQEGTCPYHNIIPAARHIRRHGATLPSHHERQIEQSLPRAVRWRLQKPERMEVGAAVADMIIDLAASIHAEYGFVATMSSFNADDISRIREMKRENGLGVHPDSPFFMLETYMTMLLHDALDEYLTKMEESQGDILDKHEHTYVRYKDLASAKNFVPKGLLDNPRLFDPEYVFMSGGFGTALMMMNTSLDAAPRLFARTFPDEPLTKERCMEAAKAFYPTIVNLAMHNVKRFQRVSPIINFNEHPEDCYDMDRTSRGRLRVQLKPELEALLALPADDEDITTRCLGIVDFGKGSVIRRVWDLHLTYAPYIYERILAKAA